MAFKPGKYHVNSPIRLSITFEEDDGDDIDPTGSVILKTRSPSGTETTYTYGTDDEIQRVATGQYTGDFTPDESGRWFFRWETTGVATTFATEGDVLVQASAFYDDLTDYA